MTLAPQDRRASHAALTTNARRDFGYSCLALGLTKSVCLWAWRVG